MPFVTCFCLVDLPQFIPFFGSSGIHLSAICRLTPQLAFLRALTPFLRYSPYNSGTVIPKLRRNFKYFPRDSTHHVALTDANLERFTCFCLSWPPFRLPQRFFPICQGTALLNLSHGLAVASVILRLADVVPFVKDFQAKM